MAVTGASDAYNQLMAGYAHTGERNRRSVYIVRSSSLSPQKILSSAYVGVEGVSDVELESSTETLDYQPHPVKPIGPNHYGISSSPELIAPVSMQNVRPDHVLVDLGAVQEARARMQANKQRIKDAQKEAKGMAGKSPERALTRPDRKELSTLIWMIINRL